MRIDALPGVSWVAETLRRQEMPDEEVGAVLTAGDRITVHRYLELHRERLQERFAEEQRTVWSIERFLSDLARSTA
jgi:hypothetical protein